jgi:HK97 family phage prohead protease
MATKRADMPSLSALMEMYEAGEEYVALEAEPEDGPEREQMVAILDLIEDLIPLEADEEIARAARAVAAKAQAAPELRYAITPITHVEVRDPTGNPDDTWTMSGYAAVFNQQTILFDSKFIRLTESVDPAFFDRVLREQPLNRPEGVVHYNFGHDMNRAVAATDVPQGMPGSLRIGPADAHGLPWLAKVPREDPDGVAMAVKMRTGVLRQASFAFTIGKAEYIVTENEDGPDEEHRRLLEADHLYDICACAQGAYPQAVSQLRSYAAAIGQPVGHHGGQPRHPGLGGERAVSPVSGGGAGKRLPAHVVRGVVLHRKAHAHEPEAQKAG